MTLLTSALGLAGGLLAGFAATWVAGAANRKPAIAFGICGFFIAILIYGASLQSLVLHANPRGVLGFDMSAEMVFLAFAACSAMVAAGIGGGLVALWCAVVRPSESAPSRFKTAGLSLLFSLSLLILAAPFLVQNQLTIERSIDAREAEIEAFTASYKNGLERLTKIGALTRIEIGDEAITHFVGDPLYSIGEKGMAEYARAALIYHTMVLGNEPMPVVLRDTDTDAKVGTFQLDGIYVVHVSTVKSADGLLQ